MAERLVTRKIPEDFFTNCKEQITAILKGTPSCESNENINDDKEQSSDYKDAENSDPDLKLKKLLEYVESVEKKSMPAHQGKAYWYSKRNDNTMESVKIRFKEKLDTMFNKLELYELKEPKEPDMPCLVFCINSTRLNEDVRDAVSGLQELNQYALVVLHFGRDALLPKSTSLHEIGGITRTFHLAYQSEGFIECKRNEMSFKEIVDFINGGHVPSSKLERFKNRCCSMYYAFRKTKEENQIVT